MKIKKFIKMLFFASLLTCNLFFASSVFAEKGTLNNKDTVEVTWECDNSTLTINENFLDLSQPSFAGLFDGLVVLKKYDLRTIITKNIMFIIQNKTLEVKSNLLNRDECLDCANIMLGRIKLVRQYIEKNLEIENILLIYKKNDCVQREYYTFIFDEKEDKYKFKNTLDKLIIDSFSRNYNDGKSTISALSTNCCGKNQKSMAIPSKGILDKGADINTIDDYGYTPLMKAVENGDVKAVETLLKEPKINVNAQNSSGFTSLMIAVKNSIKEIVEMLLQHQDIDVNIRRKRSGETALDLAIKLDSAINKEIVDLLKQHGAKA